MSDVERASAAWHRLADDEPGALPRPHTPEQGEDMSSRSGDGVSMRPSVGEGPVRLATGTGFVQRLVRGSQEQATRMYHTRKDIVRDLVGLGILFVCGGIFFALVEGWSVSDSLYYCFTTMSTIGYGDTVPMSTLGRLATVVYCFLSLVAVGYSMRVSDYAVRQMLIDELRDQRRGQDHETILSRLGLGHTRVHALITRLSLPMRKLLVMGVLSFLFWIAGAILFALVEKWDVIEALLFSLATMTTIGFSDSPSSHLGRILVVIFGFLGLACISYTLAAGQRVLADSLSATLHGREVTGAFRLHHLVRALSIFAVTYTVGVFMFLLLEQQNEEPWSLLDSMFFCATTVTTIGYGDPMVESPVSRVMLIAFIITSYVAVGYVMCLIGAVASVRFSYRSQIMIQSQREVILEQYHEDALGIITVTDEEDSSASSSPATPVFGLDSQPRDTATPATPEPLIDITMQSLGDPQQRETAAPSGCDTGSGGSTPRALPRRLQSLRRDSSASSALASPVPARPASASSSSSSSATDMSSLLGHTRRQEAQQPGGSGALTLNVGSLIRAGHIRHDFLVVLAMASALFFAMALLMLAVEPHMTFVNALYFSAVTLSTVGFGDITVTSGTAKVVVILCSFASLALISYALTLVQEASAGKVRQRLLARQRRSLGITL